MTDALPDDGLATSAAARRLIAAGLSLPEDANIPKRRIAAWAFWDWGGSAFNAIMTTFVFSTYLVSTGFGNPDKTTALLGTTGIIGGVLVALIAPVTGRRSDGTGRRKLLLGVYTAIVVLCIAATFFVRPDHSFLLLGL